MEKQKHFERDLKANQDASDKLDRELNESVKQEEVKEEVKTVKLIRVPNPEKQRIIAEHGGQISNIPINHPYWSMPDTVEKNA